ncbi:MAG: coproporphyrinogen III oxidase family protein, partial [Muribaculaceae bacterium]|nr:coproporphyrinogen III oxidase family protein [Muribaculaceae bacterium]
MCGANHQISIQKNEESDGGGLYVHIAYCRRKCLYCDFFSAGERIADWPRYVDALCYEFLHRKDELAWPLRTIYFGGGTPSLIPEDEFSRLCAFLRPYMDNVVEFTMEVNPDDVDLHRLELWKRAGVNRLSIGVQTFDDTALSAIGRRHTGTTAINAYELARKEFYNISIDLMFGLPGQTLDIWKRDLELTLKMRPEHISAYSLMYEEGTA